MIGLVLTIAVVGFIVYLITTYIPMPAIFVQVIYVLVAIMLLLYVLSVFGFGDIPIRR